MSEGPGVPGFCQDLAPTCRVKAARQMLAAWESWAAFSWVTVNIYEDNPGPWHVWLALI